MIKIWILFLMIIFVFASCKEKVISEKGAYAASMDSVFITHKIQPDTIPILDTTIFLTDILSSQYSGPNLTNEMAKEILYDHFTSQGYFRQDDIPPIISSSDSNNLIAHFDTIFLVNLNGNEFDDAVVSYGLSAWGTNGHCFLPHKAIISDVNSQYRVSNEEFIPSHYMIDSAITEGNENVIYGIDYNCGGDQKLNKEMIMHLRAKNR